MTVESAAVRLQPINVCPYAAHADMGTEELGYLLVGKERAPRHANEADMDGNSETVHVAAARIVLQAIHGW